MRHTKLESLSISEDSYLAWHTIAEHSKQHNLNSVFNLIILLRNVLSSSV